VLLNNETDKALMNSPLKLVKI